MGDFPRTERQARFIELAERHHNCFASRAEQYDRDNAFPFQNFSELRESGYLALTIPERFGGLGADLLELSLAQERIAHACGSTGLASTMHLSLLGRQGDLRLWPDEKYGEIARDVIERGALINATNSEPDLGSPSRGALPNTTAVRTADGWVINGRKSWASLSPALSWVTILAAAIDGDSTPERATFLFRTDAPGVRIEETWDNLGMRATGSHDLIFENVEIPADARVPLEGSDRQGAGTAW
jgi:alkylation response protein AidB-like acyl-CoA dehydrogenase